MLDKERWKPRAEALKDVERWWALQLKVYGEVEFDCRYCGFRVNTPQDVVDHFTDNEGNFRKPLDDPGTEKWCRGIDESLEPAYRKAHANDLVPVVLDDAYKGWLLTCVHGSPEWDDAR